VKTILAVLLLAGCSVGQQQPHDYWNRATPVAFFCLPSGKVAYVMLPTDATNDEISRACREAKPYAAGHAWATQYSIDMSDCAQLKMGCSSKNPPKPIDVPAVIGVKVTHTCDIIKRLGNGTYFNSSGSRKECEKDGAWKWVEHREYQEPRCTDLDRIEIGPDGHGKYWCHKVQP
jgi:hypothetical protein